MMVTNMLPGKGKAKGSAFEREICKKLSLWITNGQKDDCFWRSAISGGRATVAKRKGKVVRQDGDICTVSPEGHVLTDVWFLECKHVRKLDLEQFLIQGHGLLATFWKKAVKQAGAKNPIIIAKQNRWPILVITNIGLLGPMLNRVPLISTRHVDIWYFSTLIRNEFKGIK